MTVTGTFQISSILEKMAHVDKDFRYMATSDLSTELLKDSFRMDAEYEKKTCAMLLKLLLEDTSGDVQGLAVKCLGPLIKKIHENQINEITEKITEQLLKKPDKKTADTREIASMALKTIVAEVQQKDNQVIIKKVTTKLLPALAGEDSPEVKFDCLDILNDLLARFGSLMQKEHESVQKAILPQLSNSRPNTRKKAISCLGHLSLYVGDKLFVSLVEYLIENAEKGTKVDLIRTFIQAIGAISRSVGFRLGKHLSKVVPLVVKYCNDPRFKKDDELKENCFQTFESLVLRCPKEISPFLPQIIELAVSFISYDPNYESDDMDTDEPEEEEEEEEEDEDYSDDDDMSWKVRRASSKTLAAIISTRPELISDLYSSVASVLINRFNEREENVRLDIFSTFKELLKQTNILSKKAGALQGEKSPVSLLRPLVTRIISIAAKQLSDKKPKSIKTKIGVFSLLKELVLVANGILTEQIPTLVPGIVFIFNDKHSNSTLKAESLLFLRLLLSSHPASAFANHIKPLSRPAISAVSDHSYKITAEALRVLSELVQIIRQIPSTAETSELVREIFTVTSTKLKAVDVDQEVKEAAITCTGLLIANLGDKVAADVPECLKILVTRLGNEITRLVATKTFAVIAGSDLHIDLSPVLVDTIGTLSSFLRLNNRQLKQAALRSLDVIVKNYGQQDIVSSQFPAVLTQLAPLISDSDLHGSHLALNLIVNAVRANKESALIVKEKVFPHIGELVESSLLQGIALESLLQLLTELVAINAKDFGFDYLFNSFITLAKKKLHKQSTSSISQCIAALCVSASSKQLDATVNKFINDIKEKKEDKQQKLLSLLCLGEIGRRLNLSSYSNLQSVVVSVFDNQDDTSLPTAAAFALGNIAVGNLPQFLPFILQDIDTHSSRQYLLLHALKEVISRQSESEEKVAALHPFLGQLLPLLFKHCESAEEGTRNVVAECLGKLALINPDEILPKVRELLKSPSVLTRSTVIASVKFTIVEQPHPIDKLLLPSMSEFLNLITDADLGVRRSALLTLNYAAHNKPVLIRDILPNVLPHLYGETKPRPELIREVDLGPFKHKVDDGLEIRKAAFECMYTLIETSIDRLDLATFISHLVDGLKDVYDIKILSHLMLIRLAASVPAVVVEALDILIEPLRATISTKVKDNAVKQEADRNEELVRSALRAIVMIARVPNVDQHPKFEEFLRSIKGGELAEKYEAIRVDTEAIDHSDAMDTSA